MNGNTLSFFVAERSDAFSKLKNSKAKTICPIKSTAV